MRYDICIIGGAGRVGLPLGISFARAGKNVVLYDINQEALSRISEGKMPFMEAGAGEILPMIIGKKLHVSSACSVISQARFVVVVIGTPVDEHLNPQFTIFKNFFSEIIAELSDDQHVILRSTVYPGTTEKLKVLLEQNGKKTKVSFCPERITQGNSLEELGSLPQIISSFDDASLQEVRELFLCISPDTVCLTPTEAELAKLFTNVWRYIQFSIANQFFQIAAQNGLDFYKIYSALRYQYPRAQGLPGAGWAAGPCLFKDTMQLAAYSNNTFFLGHASMLINEGLPNVIVQMLEQKHSLKEKTVGILGMTFKAEIDDIRESLSYKLKKLLEIKCKKVLCADPYVNDPKLIPAQDVVDCSDIVIIGAPHHAFRNLKIDFSSKIIADVWNFFGKGGLI
jgi:UDP-N-acetyl-D-mannosaminuronic acid dehydrogenase